jgi:inosose dehydratase
VAIHVGTAPDSWGVWFPSDARQTPWSRFLDEVVEAGYSAIELGPFGYLPTAPNEIDRELTRRGLQLAGGTVGGSLAAPDGWEMMCETVRGICDVLEHLGARYLVVLDNGYAEPSGGVTGARELDDTGWERLRTTVHRLGEYSALRGIAAAFHPHAGTTVQYEPQIERLLEITDPALVNLCLDIGHHVYAGGDAVSFFRKHHLRAPYLHLKDVDATLSQRARHQDWSFARAVAEGAFVDLGQGSADVVGVARVAQEIGFDGWGIVEQDMFPAPFDKPLPIARRNRHFLGDQGIGS